MTQKELDHISRLTDVMFRKLNGTETGKAYVMGGETFIAFMDCMMSDLGYERKAGRYKEKKR